MECAMTNIGTNLLKTPVGWAFQPNNETFINSVKIASHSEDNNILSPKNLLKGFQEDLSLNAQDDENDFLTKTFLSRPLRERRNFLANVYELRNFREGGNRTNFIQTPEIRMNCVPSPAVLKLISIR